MKEGRSSIKILTGKSRGKRSRRRWEVNIRKNIKEIYVNTKNWVDSAKDRDYWGVFVSEPLNFLVL